jgi:hypothetical protein
MSAGLLCRWFLACDRLAEGYGAGPGGVEVPCCRRCADVVGIELLPLEAPPASGATITTTEDR